MEFIRRFSLHILPKRFVRIRHYGILSSTAKGTAIPTIRDQFENINVKPITTKAEPFNPLLCPCCKKQSMIRLMDFDQRGPPINWRTRNTQVLKSITMN